MKHSSGSFLVSKCQQAVAAADSGRTIFEGLFEAYEKHLRWCDSNECPGCLRREFCSLVEDLAAISSHPSATRSGGETRAPSEEEAIMLRHRLRFLCRVLTTARADDNCR